MMCACDTKWLTIQQLMDRWQMSRSKIDNMRMTGELVTMEDGKEGRGNHLVRIRLDSVEAWEKKHMVRGQG